VKFQNYIEFKMTIKIPTFNHKFIQDAVSNYIAFALMAGTGVILNFFIAWKMGFESLGIFNQIYAIYVILGQLAAFGIHDSTQKYVAEHYQNKRIQQLIAETAFWLAFISGVIIAIILFNLNDSIKTLSGSVHVAAGTTLLAPAICFFSINKTLMGVLNGKQRMKTFAIIQSTRVLIILSVCLIIGFFEKPAYMLALGFLIAEISITPILIIITKVWKWPFYCQEALTWIKIHISFGFRALSGGFLSESYIRIDILMLSIFVSDLNVGIYSFAALFVEGLFQVPVVIRTLSNPILVKLLLRNDLNKIIDFAKKISLISSSLFVLTGVFVLTLFPFLSIFYPDNFINTAHNLLFILVPGLLIYSAFIPFDFILLQSGMPGRQSLLFTINVFINIILNLWLIPIHGILGAALATSISFFISAITLNIAAKIFLGFRKSLIFYP